MKILVKDSSRLCGGIIVTSSDPREDWQAFVAAAGVVYCSVPDAYLGRLFTVLNEADALSETGPELIDTNRHVWISNVAALARAVNLLPHSSIRDVLQEDVSRWQALPRALVCLAWDHLHELGIDPMDDTLDALMEQAWKDRVGGYDPASEQAIRPATGQPFDLEVMFGSRASYLPCEHADCGRLPRE
ncbi:hypothetical protein AQ915_20745 [Burkholderia pseudomallei]|uniref:hypothetical protein n=1 Tax=Burkholderia pseudomallei TaxID=28450 RepID=UPI0009CE0A59|nr:hypothetical protein [Burkholderia pseudomallei]ONC30084.1 hypothetical protein AQ915_20745 [Burkholderia pseudomallei]